MNAIWRVFIVVAAILMKSSDALAAEVIWSGNRVVDSPIVIRRQALRIEPDAHIAFEGEGRILVEDAGLVASRAVFESCSTLTNGFRIVVQNGKVSFSHCTFRGMRTAKPAKEPYIFGFLRCQYGNDSQVEDNMFEDSDALMMLNARHVEISRNLVVRCDKAFAMLNCAECRFEGNEFFNSNVGINISSTRLTDVFRNRFTDCPVGIVLYYCKENRVLGNAFFGGAEGLQLWGLGSGGVFVGNRFEDVKYPFSKRAKCDERNVFRDNGFD